MRPELVVFDMAGTTVADGDAVNRCLRAALAAAEVKATAAAVNTVMGLPKPEAIGLLMGLAPRSARVGAIHADFQGRMNAFYADDPTVAEVPGTSQTFATLHFSGIKVALNTGFGRAIVEPLLARLGWLQAGLVDATICSDEVPRGRPHPDMIHKLMSLLGVRDSRAVVKVGDTPADLDEGTNAGCGSVIGVTSGTHSLEELILHPHSHLIDSVADLPALFRLPDERGAGSG